MRLNRIFCKSCQAELSWNTFPFYSIEFCNPDCRAVYDLGRQKIEEHMRAVKFEQMREREQAAKYFQPKPKKESKGYEKWAKQKCKCEHCLIKYKIVDGYSPRFCTLLCRNAQRTKRMKEYAREKKEDRERNRIVVKGTCEFCKLVFNKDQDSQKFCSRQCFDKRIIKKANDRWIERDLSEIDRKRAVRNRRVGQILNSDHVREKEFTGKQYKAVRG